MLDSQLSNDSCTWGSYRMYISYSMLVAILSTTNSKLELSNARTNPGPVHVIGRKSPYGSRG